jgi:hypothetical protein
VTSIAVKDIGFCAHFSRQGDWAFEFALSLARRLGHRLNIFYFPGLREYYDEKLGDFVEAGFRVCEDFVDTELRRCLFRREYQVMVLGYLGRGARFGNDSVETFAYRFNGPVVLVGPDRPDQLHLNPPARLISWQFGLAEGGWTPLVVPAEVGSPQ